MDAEQERVRQEQHYADTFIGFAIQTRTTAHQMLDAIAHRCTHYSQEAREYMVRFVERHWPVTGL